MLDRLFTTSVILMLLGIGAILGTVVLFATENMDLAFAVGGGLALIAAGIYAYCIWRGKRAKTK